MTVEEQTFLFLETYKTLEFMLNKFFNNLMTVSQYEQYIGDNSEKLRMCRLMRNFLQHNPNVTNFVYPTDNMIEFLKETILEIVKSGEKAKNISYKVKPIMLTNSVIDVCKIFVKANRDWLPIVNDENEIVGVMDDKLLFKAISFIKDNTTTVMDSLKPKDMTESLKSYKIIDCETIMCDNIYNRDCIILTRKGKYSGVIKLK